MRTHSTCRLWREPPPSQRGSERQWPPHIQIILASTRDGRAGEPIAGWFASRAEAREDLTSELVDLREWELPFLTQATPPMRGYETDITRRWAAKGDRADGYVLVTPEYNHGYPASLKNALDHSLRGVDEEAVSYVSYGGRAVGRVRSTAAPVAVELQQVPLRRQVMIPRFWSNLGEQGLPGAAYEAEAQALLDELGRGPALRTAREAGR
jgi:NAD(P)H-dependent FMN reductase